MYRAFALKASRTGADVDSEDALVALTLKTKIVLESTSQGNKVLLDGENVTDLLRRQEITAMASRVSVHGRVRSWMVAEQRAMGAQGGVVMEGRDIGTAVFPDAEVKIFLDASPEKRGERRFEQTADSSVVAEARETVIQEMRERDERDRNRAESPLRPAPDAVLVDSTSLTLDQVIAKIDAIVAPFLPESLPR